MKDVREINVCIFDYGTFIGLAKMFGKVAANTYYYSPTETEYRNVKDCCLAHGVEGVKRLDEPLDPDVLKSLDLAVFPDIGWGGLQRHLRDDMGIPVWGSFGADELELYRTRFIKTIKELGLPMVNSVTIRGLENLREHLKPLKDKYIKVNRYRENMETFHWIDYVHGYNYLNELAVEFGGCAKLIVFVVQDPIKGDPDSPVLEIGYDGACVDGEFPEDSFSGYEAKNELYLGSLMPYKEIPDVVREINEAVSPLLRERRYRNSMATEIRVKDGVGYFIDPTFRMAGQTMEHQFRNCTNYPEFIWQGANGNLIKQEFEFKFAAEATMHYCGESKEWRSLVVPKEVDEWTSLYKYMVNDGVCEFPPRKNDEVGVISAGSDTFKGVIEAIKENFQAFENEPVKANIEGFSELLKQIEDAEDEGVIFSDQKIPSPEIVLDS